jgi:signal peptidase II
MKLLSHPKLFFIGILILVGHIVGFDQYTKHLIRTNINPFKIYEVIPGCFNIIYVQNKGAIFGIFSGASESFRTPFFYSVTFAAIIIIFVLLFLMEQRQWLTKLGMGLILGGALGNFTDRIRFGQVTDFLDFYIGTHHWPAFNLADSAITVGIFIVLYDTFRDLFRQRAKNIAKGEINSP